MQAAASAVSELMYALKPPEARIVMTARRDNGGAALAALLRRVGRECTEELGAYVAAGRRNRWLDAWAKGTALPPLKQLM